MAFIFLVLIISRILTSVYVTISSHCVLSTHTVIVKSVKKTIDKHCCSYMLNINDQLVINCNDSRLLCLMLATV